MAVFPADHFIRDQASLLQGLDLGAGWAQAGYLVTFGIPPTRPETGYGYIKQGAPLDDQGRAYRVDRFIEKPPLAQAQEFLADGGYSWNSGIFLFRPDVVLEAYSRYLPDLYRELDRLRHPENQASLEEIYPRLPSISFDHGIMEKAENVAVVPVEMGWNDVGSWEALHELFPQDARGNVKEGRVLDQDSQQCVFWAHNRLVATIGLTNTYRGGYPGRHPGLPPGSGPGSQRTGGGAAPPTTGGVGAPYHGGASLGPLYGHRRRPGF